MSREIDLSTDVLLSRHGGALDVLRSISSTIPDSDWCVIGGLMTYLVLQEHSAGLGTRASQTKDADVLVEVATGSAARVVHDLVAMGFTQLERFFGQAEGQARYRMGHTLVDVLAPEDTAAADLMLAEDTLTLAAPGGRRALEVSTLVTVCYGTEGLAEFRVPMLGHAVVVKAAAVLDPRTAAQVRHLEDVVELLAAMEQPAEWGKEMNDRDSDVLERIVPRVKSAGNLEAVAALQLLIGAINENS